MNTKKEYRYYPRDFKLKVVQYCLENNIAGYKAAKKFEATDATINNWLREYKTTGDIHEPQVFKKNKKSDWITCALEPQLAEWARFKAESLGITPSAYLRRILKVLYKQDRAKKEGN